MSIPPQRCHEIGLVRRQNLSPEIIHPYLGGDGGGSGGAVSGEHDCALDAHCLQLDQHIPGFCTQRIRNADHRGQFSPESQIEARVFFRQTIKTGLFSWGNPASLILKDEVRTADEHPLTIHGAGNAVGH